MRNIFLLFILFGIQLSAFAQSPANDACQNAIVLTDLENFCSLSGAYTNVNATDEGNTPIASCFLNTTVSRDVWFQFTAIANGLSLAVIGNNDVNISGGTLANPDVAVYSGNCGALTELACNNDGAQDGFVQILSDELAVGETYFIRVSAAFGNTGTFELCINNFNLVPDPSGDCNNAVVLCDKSPFTVPRVVGAGANPNELTGATCGGQQLDEDASTWYKWTCATSGTLTFILTPLNPADDLDFYVYELPNGIDNCSGKVLRRDMSAGQQGGQPFSFWQRCTGQTGLSASSTDVSEQCGCPAGNDNFLVALNMVAGRSYALVVNNFSESGAGFSIEFGGTGTFVGPTPRFTATPSRVCVGESVTFTDASTFTTDPINIRRWNFGQGASVNPVSGSGPFTVSYNRPGVKSIVLEVETSRGCIVTEVATVEVVCCDNHFTTSANITDVNCPGTTTGSIDFSVSNAYGPYVYNWNTGASSQDITGLAAGTYSLAIRDQSGCRDTLTFSVDSPPPYDFDTLFVRPTCNGGTDGSLTFVISGGTLPYQYNWQGGGFGNNNTLSNISQGNYNLVIRDGNGCIINQTLPLRELELTLNPAVQAITQPSCFGFNNGQIVVAINNGLAPYQFDFNNGSGFQSANVLNQLVAGTYQVEVLDANLCRGDFTFTVEDHPPLVLGFDIADVSCFGETDGRIDALVSGGVGGYQYLWNTGATNSNLSQLPAASYFLTVTDANGCIIQGDTLLVQPPALLLDVAAIVDNICFGESAGSIAVIARGGRPGYEFSLDGNTYQLDSVLRNLSAGRYEVSVLDANGCTASVDAIVGEPAQLFVEAGPDRSIILGYDTLLTAFSNYAPVTFRWSPLDSLECLNVDCDRVRVDPVDLTIYTVTVVNEAGCVAVDTVLVRVIKDRPVYAPNAFSPNSDGVNDFFTLYGGPGMQRIQKLQVYSRWGSLVFEANDILPNDPKLGWDGRFMNQEVDPGVFVFRAEVLFADGVSELISGDITVLR